MRDSFTPEGEAASKGDTQEFGEMLDLEGRSLRMSGDFMITGDNGAQDVSTKFLPWA